MSDIYHITRERVVDNYDTRSIEVSVPTFGTLYIKYQFERIDFFVVYRTLTLTLGRPTQL